MNNLFDGVYFTDLERRITFWNKAAERITGFTTEEVVGHCCSDNILTHVDAEGNNLCMGLCPLAMTIADHETRRTEVFLHNKAGYRLPVSVRVVPLRDEKGDVIGAAEIFSSSLEKEAMSQRIAELEKFALVDNLTKLSNRNHTVPYLRSILEEKQRYGLPFGAIMIDVDYFKSFNDVHGHTAGDKVLEMIASTLRNSIRPFDHLGRWGGEEFLAVVRNVDKNALAAVGTKCRALVEKSYLQFENKILRCTISLGGTLARIDDTVESLLSRADYLMYESKQRGRNRLTID